MDIVLFLCNLGTTSAQIRRSRSESHSDAYDADDGEELFIPRNIKNGKHNIFFKLEIIQYPEPITY